LTEKGRRAIISRMCYNPYSLKGIKLIFKERRFLVFSVPDQDLVQEKNENPPPEPAI